jgi:hypothetical protein
MTSTIGSLAPPADGARFAGVVWGASLVQLPAMGLAPPVWKYPPSNWPRTSPLTSSTASASASAYAVLDR